ncbi:hypothetical protein Tco_0289442 [Tanacetum coccineum]
MKELDDQLQELSFSTKALEDPVRRHGELQFYSSRRTMDPVNECTKRVYTKNRPKNKQEHEETLKIILELFEKEEFVCKIFPSGIFGFPKYSSFLGQVNKARGADDTLAINNEESTLKIWGLNTFWGQMGRLASAWFPPAHSPPITTTSGCPTQIQTLRIASTQALIDALLGSRYEIGESSTARPTRGQGIDYGFVSTVDAEERRQGIRDVGYGIRDTWVDPAEAVPEIAPMTVGEVNTRVVELAELHERDTQDLYALLEDAQDSRSRISQRVDMDSQRVDLLMGDRMTLQETVWMVEEEAYASREAWAHSIGLSQATHQELQTHRDHVYAHETYLQAHQTQLQLQSTLIQTQHQVHETRFQMQQAELAALRETDRRRQDQMVETLRVIRDMRREMSDMQAELLALREQQRRARQPGPEARIPGHQDASGDTDSHL